MGSIRSVRSARLSSPRVNLARLQLEAARFDRHFVLRILRNSKRQLAPRVGNAFPAEFLFLGTADSHAGARKGKAAVRKYGGENNEIVSMRTAGTLRAWRPARIANAAPASKARPPRAIVKRIYVRWPMGERGCRKDSKNESNLFFFVFFLFVIILKIVPILGLFFFFLFVIVFGNGVDLDGMDLYDFHFGFALGAGQDFAFLDLIFVNVNFSGSI